MNPLGPRLLIAPAESEEQTTPSGLAVMSRLGLLAAGVVTGIGSGIEDRQGVDIGSRVLYYRHAAVEHDGFHLVDMEQVLALI